MDSADSVPDAAWSILDTLTAVPLWMWTIGALIGVFGILSLLYISFFLLAPTPRPPRPSEKQYITVLSDGRTSQPQPLPCWYDKHVASKEMGRKGLIPQSEAFQVEAGECFMSVIVPAYNEEQRMSGMLEEAVDYLEQCYGQHSTESKISSNGNVHPGQLQGHHNRGWEIIIVSDGSTDNTVQTALDFAKTHQLNKHAAQHGPWNDQLSHGSIPSGSIRVVQLEENRGKGGAVTHGMRHARGNYIVFADADGASKFTDLGTLVSGCERVKDTQGRAIGVGSRAHMVGTEAVVKRSVLRNTLMRCFHLLIRTLTTARTAEIKDTQCGFKLFTRPSLPYIIPYMHSEGWIFDVEMLMLAESAGISMVEVPVGWKEVMGSKLNVVKDSIGMALGLAMLRVGWGLGIYRRD